MDQCGILLNHPDTGMPCQQAHIARMCVTSVVGDELTGPLQCTSAAQTTMISKRGNLLEHMNMMPHQNACQPQIPGMVISTVPHMGCINIQDKCTNFKCKLQCKYQSSHFHSSCAFAYFMRLLATCSVGGLSYTACWSGSTLKTKAITSPGIMYTKQQNNKQKSWLPGPAAYAQSICIFMKQVVGTILPGDDSQITEVSNILIENTTANPIAFFSLGQHHLQHPSHSRMPSHNSCYHTVTTSPPNPM